jgi:hypothetical protein
VPAASSNPSGPGGAPAALARACRERGDSLRVKLGAGCAVRVDPPFIAAGDLDPDRLAFFGEQVVRFAADAMWRQYFTRRPTDPIAILLFASGESYAAQAKRLYGDRDVPYYGYYKPSSRTLIMNISTGGGTLIHELTHALIVYDFAQVPDWFNEGLSSLHEQCNSAAWRRGELKGDVNWRLPELQKAIGAGKLRPLRELITVDDFRGEQESLNYAQARYFCMYMQSRGALGSFYKSFRNGYREDHTGLSYAEEVLGKRRIELIERDFVDWVMRLHWQP